MTSSGRQVMVQGRIVWVCGDLFKGRPKTDFNTRQPIMDIKTGKPLVEYGFGLAVPKSVLNQTGKGQPGEIWAAIHEETFTLYPSRQIPPSFAMKYKDGDGIDNTGVSFAQREGYAGHLVFALTTQLPIKFFKFENNQNFLVNEGIKCGDYVNVQLSIKAHPAKGQGKPGLYLNPNAVQLIGYGKEIVNIPSGDAIFGTVAPQVPNGASSVPVAPAGFITPPSQQEVQPMGQAYGQPQAQPTAPNYGVLPPTFQPAATPQQPMVNHAPQFAQSVAATPGSMPAVNATSAGMPPIPTFNR